jgi:acyl-CoA thioester hydrolase
VTRADFPHLLEIQTRWNDNDLYGHVNNVVYYAYFDTVINRYLIEEGGLDIDRGAAIGVCVESHCSFEHSIAFPDTLHAGLRVEKLGNSSVRYAIGIFHGEVLCAQGWFVHVFVSRATRRPTPIPAQIRAALARIGGGEVK